MLNLYILENMIKNFSMLVFTTQNVYKKIEFFFK